MEPEKLTNTPAVVVDHLYKSFKLPHEQASGIKQLLINKLKGKRGYEIQHVLKNVSFQVEKGEFLGIVGRNGSGKSTLLKLLAGIYTPDKGSVQVNGTLTPFIELGVGFNPELTGRENVYLNGALLGLSKKDMDDIYDEIVEFAELERFMDQKLKNYSSGMQVRLAFSIAIRSKSDILLFDEVLAVGDAAFQRKCTDYFKLASQLNKTVILVTHDMNAVRQFCTKAIFVEDGQIKETGSPNDIADLYTIKNLQATVLGDQTQLGNEVEKFSIRTVSPVVLKPEDKLVLEIEYQLKEEMAVDVGFSLAYRDISVIQANTSHESISLPSTPGKLHKVRFSLSIDNLASVELEAYGAIFKKDGFIQIGSSRRSAIVAISNPQDTAGGLMVASGGWELL